MSSASMNGRTGQKCSAHTGNGTACKAWAIKGGTVCVYHGGKSPQVRRKAEERLAEARRELLEMIDPALKKLRELSEAADSESVALSASKDILDRNGLGSTKSIEVTHHDGDSELDREIGGLLNRMEALEAGSESESVDSG